MLKHNQHTHPMTDIKRVTVFIAAIESNYNRFERFCGFWEKNK